MNGSKTTPATISDAKDEPPAASQEEGAPASAGDVGDLAWATHFRGKNITDKPLVIAQKAASGKPRINLPGKGRPHSIFASQVGQALSQNHAFYRRDDDVVQIREREFDDDLRVMGFDITKPVQAVTAVEECVELGTMQPIEGTNQEEFVPESMSVSCANKLINAAQFKRALPAIRRILDIQIPIKWNREITHPGFGYDPRFHVYLNSEAPRISPTPLSEAKTVLNETLGGFCFRDQQSVTNAVAFLITPYMQGLNGFSRKISTLHFRRQPTACREGLLGGA